MNTPPWPNQQPPYGVPGAYPGRPAGSYGAPAPSGHVDPVTGLELAGFGRRLSARLIDYTMLTVLLVVFFVASTIFLAIVNPDMGDAASDGVGELWAYLLFFGWGLALFLYDWLFLAASGRTVGKRLVSIKVVRSDGGRLRQGQTVGRSALFGLPHSILCLGHVYLLIDCAGPLADTRRRQSLHDKAAGTIVIRG